MRIPSNLVGHVLPLEDPEADGIQRSFALGSQAGGVGFEIYYFGELFEPENYLDGNAKLIVGTHRGTDRETPAIVVARPLSTAGTSDIVLFDGAVHGYDAMFVQDYDPALLASRSVENQLEINGESVFAVTISVIDNIDWDEEEVDFLDENSQLRLLNGTVIDAEQLRADGYDAIGIDVVDAHGRSTEILNEELA